ncbi:uncharacterized protein LOC135962302 [Calliphora vicina]|uniref:uncharacterized protein LOC135962302 n=1 Tax=Calliphora vicina TaxID=7373 RepID=UPI00325C1837
MNFPDSKEINLVRCLKCGKILKCSRYDTAALLEHIRNDHPEVDIIDTDTKQKRTTVTKSTKSSPKQYRESQVNRSTGYSEPEDEIKKCECSEEDCDCEAEQYQPYNRQHNVSYENTEDEERGPKRPQYLKDVDMTHYSITSEILDKYPEIKECEYCPYNPNAQVIYTRRYKVNTPSTVNTDVLQRPFQRNLYCTSIEKWCPANGSIHCPKCGCNKRPLIKTRAQRFSHNECAACCLLSCWPFCFLPWLLPSQSQECLYCANCKTFLGLYDRNTNCIQPNRLYITVDQQAKDVEKDLTKDNKLLANESSPAQSSAGDSAKSKHLPSIVIDGKELPPDMVAKIQKFKRYGSMAGIDLDALTNPSDSAKSTKRDGPFKENQDAAPAPSGDKANRQSVIDNV